MAAKRVATASAVGALITELTDLQLLTLTESDNRPRLRETLDAWGREKTAVVAIAKTLTIANFVIPLPDALFMAAEWESSWFASILAHAAPHVPAYRAALTAIGWPVAYTVARFHVGGFSMKRHAPETGECFEGWSHLMEWEFPDTLVTPVLSFGAPMILPGTLGHDVSAQHGVRGEWFEANSLPSTHNIGFGSAPVLTGVIQSHHAETGDRCPEDGIVIRTDDRSGGGRIGLGWGGRGLGCGCWGWGGVGAGDLGCAPLGVMDLGHLVT